MSIFSLFLRFTISYAFAMVTAYVTVAFFGLDDTGFISLILLGISWWCLSSYSVKNSRKVEGREKWKLTGVVLAGSILVESLLFSLALLIKEVPLNAVWIKLVIAIPSNFLAILIAHWGVKKEILMKLKA
ncbi:MAG: hypothetical protein ACI8ZB_003314 [Desulforhopalus sp.]|jgi:hypothetical protein